MVLPGLSLFDEALQDVFGANAAHATLRNVSGFEDPQQVALLQSLREEAERPVASRLFVQALRRLLRETQLSLVTVANAVGYSNPSHFAHVFRKRTGLTQATTGASVRALLAADRAR